jgi:asparagine synthase (glutamine-hydrolysing)
MCGLAGFIGQQDAGLLESMSLSLEHRGPDDSGIFVGKEINFAFRRMSVIDLSHGHQPIYSENKKIVGMVNGEIYNFKELRQDLVNAGCKFSSNSDSEVVIQGYQYWGTEVFSKLRGMFAVALWDIDKEKLILARDSIGKKPIHYYIDIDKAIFASEIKTLAIAAKRKLELDTDSITEYFTLESIGNDKSIYKNVYKVQAGHYVTIDKNLVVEKHRFWFPKLELSQLPKTEVIDEIDRKINSAVEKRLVADVPIGLFLSGGIDSATVMANVAKLGRKDVKVFTAKFSDRSYDESSEARRIANYYGFETVPIQITNNSASNALDEVIDCIDEPLSDPAIIPQLSLSRIAKDHVDVVLTGDGGDELFLGYPNFKAHDLYKKYSFLWKFSPLLKILLRNIPSKGNYFDFGFKTQRFSRGLGEDDFWVRDSQWRGAFTNQNLAALLKTTSDSDVRELLLSRINNELNNIGSFKSESQEISYGYLTTFLRDNVLVKVDRATMKYGLEARSPLLDEDLFEFINQIPDGLRMSSLGSKWMLKSVLRKHLPENFIAKRKHGFGVPVGKWLNDDLKVQLLDFMNPTFLNNQGIFDSKLINQMQLDHQSGRYDYRRELWSFLIFQRWFSKWMA